jgi:hypothetical protein
MEQTIKLLENCPSWKESMRKSCRANKLNIDIVAYYTPLKFRASYSRFKAMYSLSHLATKKKVLTKLKDGYKMSSKHSIGFVLPLAVSIKLKLSTL